MYHDNTMGYMAIGRSTHEPIPDLAHGRQARLVGITGVIVLSDMSRLSMRYWFLSGMEPNLRRAAVVHVKLYNKGNLQP